ncbi:MAG: PQQ-dependent sugar dehydrogenase [Ardenticatenaceae bacterium]|nr:PQQ-dependent sugar dehydrogenase [Ardenticatenaceae bacterium]MCB9443064.1 PQQ-dependent sugar dehydrogenase [Ardenticatenaceae bacterium]
MRFFRFFLIVFVLMMVACSGTAVSTPTLTSEPTTVAVAQPTNPLTAQLTDTAVSATEPPPATATTKPTSTNTAVPTDTPIPQTDTETSEATETAVSANTATPAPAADDGGEEATAVPPTTAAPPPSTTGVEQPPYEASACSDKYPCNDDRAAWEARIRVPAGFTDTYFAQVPGAPTSMTFGPDGMLYVAIQTGTIYRLDSAGNVFAYVSGFNFPTGIAFRPGTSDLYVSDRINNAAVGGESRISIVQGGAIRQIIGGLPCCYASMHAANGIAFGADGWGYVGVGGRADHGEILVGDNAGQMNELHPYEASILRFSPDGSVVENYARGFRNPYDIAWDGNGQLWATDNEPDFGPVEELHRVIPGGQHGYPWFDCDVCFPAPPDVQVIPPAWTFTPHASPTGITSYLSNLFPGYYNSLFLTLWSAFPGAQKVVRMAPNATSATNFATGFASPIDVTVGPDGSLYVADWATGIIFKISYIG